MLIARLWPQFFQKKKRCLEKKSRRESLCHFAAFQIDNITLKKNRFFKLFTNLFFYENSHQILSFLLRYHFDFS